MAIEIDTAVSASILHLMVPNIVGTYSVADITTTTWASLTLITHWYTLFGPLPGWFMVIIQMAEIWNVLPKGEN